MLVNVDSTGMDDGSASMPVPAGVSPQVNLPGPFDASGPHLDGLSRSAAPPASPNPLATAHRVLRGHYPIAVSLAVICAVAGAAVGWVKLGKRTYTSEGLVRIAYALRPIEKETDQNRPMSQFDEFLRSQQTLMSSHRIVEEATTRPVWQATGRGTTPQVFKAFGERMLVEVKKGTEFLNVSYTDEDPRIASAAVKAIIESYRIVYEAEESDRSRIKVLEDQRTEIEAELGQTEKKIDEFVHLYGTTNLDTQFTDAQTRVLQLKNRLGELSLLLASGNTAEDVAAAAATQPSATAQASRPAAQRMSPQRIAMGGDATMRNYLDELARCENKVEELRDHGYQDSHPVVNEALRSVARAKQRVEKYADDYNAYAAAIAPEANWARSANGSPVLMLPTRQAILDQQRQVQALYDKSHAEMLELGDQRRTLDELVKRAGKDREDIEKKTTRLDTLQTEGSLGGRLSVISDGEVPLVPSRDTRVRMAAVGSMAGAAFPFAFFVALGLMRPRYRYSDEAHQQGLVAQLPLLGVVPGLDNASSDMSMAAAAQCIHQMRVMLQVGQNPQHSNVYLVSSSTAGEGKTSIATSLALSFAGSGARTLLIDCDLVGQNLTRNLAAQSEQGLREALGAGTVRGHLKRTIAGLAVMTVGRATEEDAATVSLAAMRRLLADARDHFDVVVMDSGPILGSVEATAAAQVADRVIFTIARGQQQFLANRAIRQLRSLGASFAGVVFNRAKTTDFHHSGYASSYRTVSAASQDPSGHALARQPQAQAKASRFGPLVRAVIASLPPDLTRAPVGAGAN